MPGRQKPTIVAHDNDLLERLTATMVDSVTTSVPNPLCDIGRTHPRDRHRMRPVEGRENVWYCPKHDLYAEVIETATAGGLDRGDSFPLPDGTPGTVLRHGDERAGGTLVYVRSEG